MLTSALILPHSPILIPAIGKTNTLILDKTTLAYNKIAESLKEQEVDELIIISNHFADSDTDFVINSAPEFQLNFKKFGDLVTRHKISGDLTLAHEISESLKDNFSLKIISEKMPSYCVAIPAYLLGAKNNKLKMISLGYHPEVKREKLIAFGQGLKNELFKSSKKIALIATGDLSHRLKRNGPGGYSPKGAKYDQKMIEYLNEPENVISNLLSIDEKLIKDAMECAFKSILVLMGALDGLDYEPQTLAYQNDLGIGYLTMELKLNL
jgi:MEMO1 family protein